MTSGIVLLNKQPGKTSFQSLSALKKIYSTKKVGHTGTLDKFASGVMVVCVGKFTRLASYFEAESKAYRASVYFGSRTDTLDPEGEIVETGPVPDLKAIETIIPLFLGKQMQTPPKYSAIHIDGKRAYQRTLAGEDISVPEREIEIHSLKILEYAHGVLKIDVDCSKGTYIRSFARDLGRKLGTAAYLTELKRTKVGNVSIEDCMKVEDIEQKSKSCLIKGKRLCSLVPQFGQLVIKSGYLNDFLNGKMIQENWFEELYLLHTDERNTFFVLDNNDTIRGVISKGEQLKYQMVFP